MLSHPLHSYPLQLLLHSYPLQLLLHSYPLQLLLHSYPLQLLVTSLEHSVSFSTMIERVLLLLCTHYSC